MDALKEILVKFGADFTPMQEGLKGAETKVSGFESTLKKLGGVVAGAFAGKAIFNFVNDLIHTADATAKMADSLGMGIVELQEWQHAADLSGVATELLTMSMGKLNLQLNEAATKGTGPAAESLKALGLEAENAEGKLKSSGQIIEEVADAIQGMDVTERNAQLMKLFGEQGAKLVPMLKGGSAGIRAMRAEVEALGFAFDEDFARNAEAFDDNIDRLKKGFKGFVIQGLGPILPDLIDLTNYLVQGAKATIPMVKGFISFIKQTKILQAALALLGFKGLGFLTKYLGGVVTKMGGLRGVFARIIPLVWKFIAPLLILEDIFVFLAGGDSAIGKTMDKIFGDGTQGDVRTFLTDLAKIFKKLTESPREFSGTWRDASRQMEKDMGTTGSVLGGLFSGLHSDWTIVVESFSNSWSQTWGKIKAIAENQGNGLKLIFTEVKFVGLGVAAAISDAFFGMWNGIVDKGKEALNNLASDIEGLPLIGGFADSIKSAAKSVGGMKGQEGTSEVVSQRLEAARATLAADIEAAQAKIYAAPTQTVTNQAAQSVSNQTTNQNIQNDTTVNVTVPEGTGPGVARRVGQAAAQGATQGNTKNMRATRDALVPSPA